MDRRDVSLAGHVGNTTASDLAAPFQILDTPRGVASM
jgi:hypothetical protein